MLVLDVTQRLAPAGVPRGEPGMKIALVSTVSLFPCDAGHKARILTLLRTLRALGHDVTFVLLSTPSDMRLDLVAHEREIGADRLHIFRRRWPSSLVYKFRRLAGRLRRGVLFRNHPDKHYLHGLDELFYPPFGTDFRRLQATNAFDAVLVEHVFASKILEAVEGPALKLIDTHDIFAHRHRLFLQRGQPYTYYSLTPRDEERGLSRADVVIAIQEDEATALARRIQGPAPLVRTVSHLLDLNRRVRPVEFRSLSFVASSSGMNREGLAYFVEQVMPLLTASYPDLKLHVAGSICQAVEDHASLIKIGYVDDLAEVFERGAVSVNPVRVGTGINIKLLDALAHGIPVVTTEVGARGLPAALRKAIMVVGDDDAEGFARAIEHVVSDRGVYDRLASAAYRAAEAWNASQRENLAVIFGGSPPPAWDAVVADVASRR